METWSEVKFARLGIRASFVQENQSLSLKAFTLRGLHFQRAPFVQSKLVRVLAGKIFDVAVDLRQDSPTFGKWHGVTLAADDGQQIYIGPGFAHGFMSLEANTLVAYKVDAPYAPNHEGGICWNDGDIGIKWPRLDNSVTLSERDKMLPNLTNCVF